MAGDQPEQAPRPELLVEDLSWGPKLLPGASDEAGGRSLVTLRVPVDVLGLPPPPAEVRLRALPGEEGWRVFARSASEDRRCVSWLCRIGMGQPEQVSSLGRSSRVLFAQLDPLWATLVEDLGLQNARIRPDGWASMVFEGERDLLGELVDGSILPTEDLEVEAVTPVDEIGGQEHQDLLTPTQREALAAALTAGYYTVPRGTTLRDLADQLEVSASSLSERIRRAEGRLVRAHLGEDA